VEEDVMNAHIIFGLFALYAAATSLYMVLSGRQDAVLANLRRLWGRTLGHSIYFVARVALPMLICVFCLGWGVRNYDATVAMHHSEPELNLNVDSYRNLIRMWEQENPIDPHDIVYGA
jgi:hypothetical protein